MAAHGNGTASGPCLGVVYCVICLILITNVSFIKTDIFVPTNHPNYPINNVPETKKISLKLNSSKFS